MKQIQALAILKTGANVFLTGEPGSGKTYVVNAYIQYLRGLGIKPAITASTGIAATHIGGMTIHAWSGIGIKEQLTKQDLARIITNKRITSRIKRARVLIIEEVSMLSPPTVEMIDLVCRKVRENEKSFGGMQVVFVGDFFQLPPVVKMEVGKQNKLMEKIEGRLAYDSTSWSEAEPLECYLSEQHRQDDSDLLSLLSAIRRNECEQEHVDLIESRKISNETTPGEVPKLFSRNVDVDRINNQVLAGLASESEQFAMRERGPKQVIEALKRGCLSPESLELKVGAAVMFTKNSPKDGFVNGTLGVIEEFAGENGYPVVRLRDGKLIEVEPMIWMIEENDKVVAEITQLPLRLAWAITIHKSQGMTMDEAIMNLSDVFEYGQGYVALSRVRRLSGLHILGWNRRAFEVHPEVVVRDRQLRKLSVAVIDKFIMMGKREIYDQQIQFVKECGGGKKKHPTSQKAPLGARLAEMREKHPNAYRSWSEEDDNKLEKLHGERKSTKELVKIFGRQRGAIRARLLKLGLIEK